MKLKKKNSRSNGVIFDADMLVTRYLYMYCILFTTPIMVDRRNIFCGNTFST